MIGEESRARLGPLGKLFFDGADNAVEKAKVAFVQTQVKHYEISGYGTVRAMARQLGELEVEKLLSRTLGEEESADFLLTEPAKPLVQQALAEDLEL